MRRCLAGLNQAAQAVEVADGIYLVRIERTQYRWHRQKPFYAIEFTIVEPQDLAGRTIVSRIYCTTKALWKFIWFLRDFGYDPELLERDELEESSLLELQGVIKISHTTVNGTSLLNLEAFAPAAQWNDSPMRLPTSSHDSEVAS